MRSSRVLSRLSRGSPVRRDAIRAMLADWAERQVEFAHMIPSLCIAFHILLGM